MKLCLAVFLFFVKCYIQSSLLLSRSSLRTMFHQAQNLNFLNSQFTDVAPGATFHQHVHLEHPDSDPDARVNEHIQQIHAMQQRQKEEEAITQTLFGHIAPRALYDAMDRTDAPRCMRGTRDRLQEDLMSWVRNTNGRWDATTQLWLTGAAGSGKSAVAQSVAETCAREGILAATFFFSFRWEETNNYSRFVPTLSYQLAQNLAGTRSFIGSAVVKDVAVVKKKLKKQLKALVLQPIALACRKEAEEAGAGEQRRWPHVIIVDGVDECKKESEQAAVLDALHKLVALEQSPFRVVIVTRPEAEMRSYFHGVGAGFTRKIDLNEDYDVEPDLKIFLDVSFAAIRAQNKVEEEWPGEDVVRTLVKNASGQFIYASTVVEYVGDPARRPKEYLQAVLDVQVNRAGKHPLSPLYALYASILDKCPDPVESVSAIQIIERLESSDETFLTAAEQNHFLGYRRDVWARIFDNLHSLLFIPEFDDVRSFHKIRHKSLVDFLRSEEHALHLFVSREQVSTILCIRWLKLLKSYKRAREEYIDSISTSTFMYDCHLKDPQLRQLMEGCSVTEWARQNDLVRLSDLDVMYLRVHHYDLGCRLFRCGGICRRWRAELLLHCSTQELLRPPPFVERLKSRWSPPLHGSLDKGARFFVARWPV
ncbi:hypothetical protein FA15DRAFT_671431 [Coprinopsis marcescibilis]|uniref:Nephrocystin 3-like N-terminal domain-containing protein n=1 Tax=Coprinopsis marcescibilis TaxID=230819 RepID=A0A5C3KQB3_COPMA|nr:hypothetical protein FA15DRAFT_671431 [Coprinopsis marcescibilis]